MSNEILDEQRLVNVRTAGENGKEITMGSSNDLLRKQIQRRKHSQQSLKQQMIIVYHKMCQRNRKKLRIKLIT